MTQTDPKQTANSPAPEEAEGVSVPETEAEPTAPEPEIIDADDIVDADAADAAQGVAENEADNASPVDIEINDDEGEEAGPEERIQILEAQVSDLNDKLLRTMAEMENVRRRAQREKEDASKFAIANFAKEMLGVADNITRAFASVEGEGKGADAPPEDVANQFAAFIEGVRMTEAELMKTLEKLGLQKIEPLGQRFDANLHEALFEFEDKEQVAGTVAQVLEQGYTLNGRLLRAAKVGITKGGPKASAQPADDAASEEAPSPETKTAYETKSQEPGGQVNEEL